MIIKINHHQQKRKRMKGLIGKLRDSIMLSTYGQCNRPTQRRRKIHHGPEHMKMMTSHLG